MFRALADPSRRLLLDRLRGRDGQSLTELTSVLSMTRFGVRKHLQVLERAGIVMSEKVGRVRTYQLASDALVPVNAWIVARRRPQEAQLDRLGDYLTRHPKTIKKKGNLR